MELIHLQQIATSVSTEKENVEPARKQLKDTDIFGKKNVVFSPQHLKSCFSIPKKPAVPPKSILKTPSKIIPTFDALATTFKASTSPSAPRITFSHIETIPLLIQNDPDKMTSSDGFVQKAVDALKEGSVEDRIEAYRMLHCRLTAKDEATNPEIFENLIDELIKSFKRDIPIENNEICTFALRSLGYLLFTQGIVTMFKDSDLRDILIILMDKIQSTKNKNICHLCAWCIGIQRMPADAIAPLTSRLIDVLIIVINSPWKSSSLQLESVNALLSLANQVPEQVVSLAIVWLPTMLNFLISPMVGQREKSLNVLTLLLPQLMEENDDLRNFFDNFCLNESQKFAEKLSTLIAKNEELFVIKTWGVMVLLLGKRTHSKALNYFLPIMEDCFNSRKNKNNVKIAALQSWTNLIFSFTIDNHIAHAKRINLIMHPINDGLNYNSPPEVRYAAANTWIALVVACGDHLIRVFEIVVLKTLSFILSDGDVKVRQLGLGVIAALLGGESRLSYVETIKLILNVDQLESSDVLRLEPKWVRSHIKVVLEMMFSLLRNQHRADEELWAEGMQGRILTKTSANLWESLMKSLHSVNQKEVNPSQESIASLHSCLRFLKRLLTDENALITEDWMAKYEIVKYLADTTAAFYGSRSFSSSKYRMLEEESRFNSEIKVKMMVTPLLYLITLWLDVPDDFIGTKTEKVYWQMVSSILDMAVGTFDILDNTIVLLTQRPPEMSNKEVLFRVGWWHRIASSLYSHISRSGEISDAMNPFDEGYHSVLHSTLVYPLRLAMVLDETVMNVWTELLSTCYTVARTKIQDANSFIDSLAAKCAAALKASDEEIFTSEILRSAVLMVCVMLDSVEIPNIIGTPTSSGNIKAFTKEGRQHKRLPLESLLMLTATTFKYAYTWLDKAKQEEANPAFIHRLFGSITALLHKVSPSIGLSLLSLFQESIILWVGDTECYVTDQRHLAKIQYNSLINKFWEEILNVLQNQPTHDSKLLESSFEILAIGLSNNQKNILNATLNFWNTTFGQQKDLKYPPGFVGTLGSLQTLVEISLPAFPESSSQVKNIPHTGNPIYPTRELSQIMPIASALISRIRPVISPVSSDPPKSELVRPSTPTKSTGKLYMNILSPQIDENGATILTARKITKDIRPNYEQVRKGRIPMATAGSEQIEEQETNALITTMGPGNRNLGAKSDKKRVRMPGTYMSPWVRNPVTQMNAVVDDEDVDSSKPTKKHRKIHSEFEAVAVQASKVTKRGRKPKASQPSKDVIIDLGHPATSQVRNVAHGTATTAQDFDIMRALTNLRENADHLNSLSKNDLFQFQQELVSLTTSAMTIYQEKFLNR